MTTSKRKTVEERGVGGGGGGGGGYSFSKFHTKSTAHFEIQFLVLFTTFFFTSLAFRLLLFHFYLKSFT